MGTKILIKRFVFIALFIVFAVSFFSIFFKGNVEGQNNGSNSQSNVGQSSLFGASCIQNYLNCGEYGKQNLLEGLRNGNISVVGPYSAENLISQIETFLGEKENCGGDICVNYDDQSVQAKTQRINDLSNKLCVDSSVSTIHPIVNGMLRNDLLKRDGSYFYSCGTDTVAMRDNSGRNNSPDDGFEIWGCCRPDEIFLVPNDITLGSADAYQAKGGCCPKNTQANSLDQDGSFCYKDNISTEIPARKDEIYGKRLSYYPFANEDLSSRINIDGSADSVPNKVCSRNSVCALSETPCTLKDCTTLIFGNSYIVKTETIDRDTGLQCQKCFLEGEPIGIIDDKLAFCTRDGFIEGQLKTEELVNGSVSDTIACLRSEGGTTGENYRLCKSCREQGGTWSGLGCIDSTPVGVITWIIRIAYGVMGGVALIQFIIAGVYYQTGQEEKVKEARKNIIATISGLALLTFSIVILRIIGVNLLDIIPIGSI